MGVDGVILCFIILSVINFEKFSFNSFSNFYDFLFFLWLIGFVYIKFDVYYFIEFLKS